MKIEIDPKAATYIKQSVDDATVFVEKQERPREI